MRNVATYNCDYYFRYSLMMDCWGKKSEQRPSFAELVTILSSKLADTAEYIDLSSHLIVQSVQVEDRV